MDLKILLPYQVFLEVSDVTALAVDSDIGEIELLPNRLDCVIVLKPGILSFRNQTHDAAYVATDEGILVKAGAIVTVSVRRAIGGSSLETLHGAVEKEFLNRATSDANSRTILSHMESEFIQRFMEFKNG
jgi:F-type H+-transporting ATPase subunit epsilon